MELTERRQGIHKVMSIFDVRVGKELGLPVHMTIRVMFTYDEETQTKEFRILNNRITPETKMKIHGWLQGMIVDVKVIQSFGSNEMDGSVLKGRQFLVAGHDSY